MSTTSQSPPRIGRCPECRTVIASFDVRIDEPAGCLPTVLAECPTCRKSVNPK